jgi:hypothetical protein
MGNKKPSSRIVCEAKCILEFNDFEYYGVIKNLSLSGALIVLSNKFPNNISPEDICDLMFCSDLGLYPMKYACKVIRVDSEIIGAQFLELNMM